MTRIAYIIQGLWNSGGMERVLTTRANALANCFDITFITHQQVDRPNCFVLDNRIHHIDIQNLDYKKTLIDILFKEHYDIVVSTGGPEFLFLYSIADGSKKVFEFHFSYDISKVWCSNIQNPLWKKVKIWLQTWKRIYYARHYDYTVVLCKTDAMKWRRWLKNVDYIYNPLTINVEEKSDCTSKNVIAVGRLNIQKGFDMLIEAWKIVNSKHPDWNLNIYGEGEERTKLEGLIGQFGLQSTIKLQGQTQEVASKYLDSSIFVLSSRDEGFGLVITEAEACGLPIVTFDCPSAPKELVKDGINGYIVPLGDIEELAHKIIHLMQNEPQRVLFGEESRRIAQQFSIESISQKWMELYKKVLSLS